jgi:hypothetical protein
LVIGRWSLPEACAQEGPAEKDPRAILLRAIKAHGGADKLAQLRIIREQSRGTLSVLGMKVAFTQEVLFRAPDQFRITQTTDLPGKRLLIVQVFDGKKGWRIQGGVPKAADEKTLANWKELAHATYVGTLTPLLAADKGYTLALLGEVEVKGKKAVGLKVSFKGRRDVSLYFDRDSGLLVRKTFQPRPGGKEAVQDEVYSDFKEVEGVKRAGHVTALSGGTLRAEIDVTMTRFPDRIDDKNFREQ